MLCEHFQEMMAVCSIQVTEPHTSTPLQYRSLKTFW